MLNPSASHVQMPLTAKVGEVAPESEKYLSWSGTYGYYGRISTSGQAFQTEKMANPAFTVKDIELNRTVNSRLMNKNKSLVEFKSTRTNNILRNTLSRTNSVESFVDFKDTQSMLRDYGTPEQFRPSFERYLRQNPNIPGSEVVAVHSVGLMVKDCLGPQIPDFIIYKFKELSIGAAINGEVYWDDFCTVIDKVVASVNSETARHSDLPPLVTLMTRKRVVDEDLGALGESSTTFRDNYAAKTGLAYLAAPDGSFNYERPNEPVGEHLNAAAKLLCAGTTKITKQIPGYKGHIPTNLRNERKLEHACGKNPHPVYNNLILSQRGMGCVLGYTGHVPAETFFPRTERLTSCDPHTSNGAAYGGSKALL